MKFRPVGIYSEDKTKSGGYMRATDFSNDRYDGVELRRTQKGLSVVIMHCKRDDPMRWMVQYGFSSVFFNTFADAVEFCNSRGMEIMKEQVEN